MVPQSAEADLRGAVKYLLGVLRPTRRWEKNWSPEAIYWLARHTGHWARRVLTLREADKRG